MAGAGIRGRLWETSVNPPAPAVFIAKLVPASCSMLIFVIFDRKTINRRISIDDILCFLFVDKNKKINIQKYS